MSSDCSATRPGRTGPPRSERRTTGSNTSRRSTRSRSWLGCRRSHSSHRWSQTGSMDRRSVVHAVPPYRGLVSLLRQSAEGPSQRRPGHRQRRLPRALLCREYSGRSPHCSQLPDAGATRSTSSATSTRCSGPGGPGGMARPVLRRFATGITRWAVRTASVQAYVTAGALQARYPPRSGLGTVHCLAESELAELPVNPVAVRAAANRLSAVGSMEQHYKGFDTLIAAVRLLEDGGMPVHLTIVGSGRHAGHYAGFGLASRTRGRSCSHRPGCRKRRGDHALVAVGPVRSQLHHRRVAPILARSNGMRSAMCGNQRGRSPRSTRPELPGGTRSTRSTRREDSGGSPRPSATGSRQPPRTAPLRRSSCVPLQGERRNAFLRDVAAARLSSNSERSTWRLRSRFHGTRRSGR